MLEIALLAYGMLCVMWVILGAGLFLSEDSPRDNFTYARLGLALVFLPGTVLILVCGIAAAVLIAVFTALDKPIRR